MVTRYLRVAGHGEPFAIDGGLLRLGRDPSCDVVLPCRQVSRLHAGILLLPEGQCVLLDLGSTNGIAVCGVRVRRHFLRPGDEFHLGGVHCEYLERPVADGNGPPRPAGFPLPTWSLDQLEAWHIERALVQNQGEIGPTARALGLAPAALRRKLQRGAMHGDRR